MSALQVAEPQPRPPGTIEICSDPGMAPGADDCAYGMISAVLARYRCTDGARVRITGAAGPGRSHLLQVTLRVFGAPARVQATGDGLAQTVAAGAARLDRQLHRLTTGWEQWPWPDPDHRYLGRPGPGRIVRLKSARLRSARPCQAAAHLAAMDFDVHLFTDSTTGQDAIVFRAGPTGLRLARQRSMHPPVTPHLPPITAHPLATPTLNEAAATDRLTRYGLPYLFFTNEGSGRGNLLYRRYDGDLGLIGPLAPGRPHTTSPSEVRR